MFPLPYLRQWPRALRGLLLLAGLLFAVVLILSVVAYFQGDDWVLPWQLTTDIREVPVAFDALTLGARQLPLTAPGFLTTQTLAPGLPLVNLTVAPLGLLLLTLFLAGFLAALPGVGWRTFLVGAGALILFLSTLNADLLGIFSATGQFTLMLVVAVLGGTAYAFRTWAPRVTPDRRLLVFLLLLLALGWLIFHRSPLSARLTALHLTSYALAGALVASALFIGWVSYENIRALLWLSGQSPDARRRRGLRAFGLAAGLYLLNLLLLFLSSFGFVKLGGAFLDAFFVLLGSVISGLLGLRLREAEYGKAVPYLLMLPLYLLLAALTLGTLGFAFATANDPLIEAFTDGIIVTHLTAGAAFLIYVLYNFAPLIQQRRQAYRVVYLPKRLPMFAFYVIAAVALVAVLYQNQLFLMRQLKAGYYDALGDLYVATGDTELGERYYQQANFEVPFNVKANTALAALASSANERGQELLRLRLALKRNPTEKTYARLATLYPNTTQFFDQQEVLRSGLKDFPRSAPLNLLLGTLYSRTTLADSVEYYFRRASRTANRQEQQVLLTNQLSFLLRNNLLAPALELTRQLPPHVPVALQANADLTRLLLHQPNAPGLPPAAIADSLTPATFAHLNQRVLQQVQQRDTPALSTLQFLLRRSVNAVYAPDLLFMRALLLRAGGEFGRARATLLEVISVSSGETAGARKQLLGQWLLADGLPAQAAATFADATTDGDQLSFLYHAFALAAAGQPDSARRTTQLVTTAPEPTLRSAGQRLAGILLREPSQLPTDSLRLDYLTFHPEAAAAVQDSVLQSIANPELRAPAAALVAERALARGDISRAARTLAAPLPDSAAPLLRWLKAEVAVRSGKIHETEDLLGKTPPQEPRALGYYLYINGLLAEARNHAGAATKAYQQLAHRAPFLTRGLLAAADFFRRNPPTNRPLLAYNTLLAGIGYQPESVPLLQAYALTAVREGLGLMTDDVLLRLERLLTPVEYLTFRTQYDAELQRVRAAF